MLRFYKFVRCSCSNSLDSLSTTGAVKSSLHIVRSFVSVPQQPLTAMAHLQDNPLKRKQTANQPVSPPLTKRKLQSTTTKASVSSFFTPASQRLPEKTKWRVVNGSLLVARCQPQATPNGSQPLQKRQRIVGFDLDGTLITSVSGNKFAKDGTDWKWWNPVVPETLKKLEQDGYQIIVFSNQAGISLKSNPKSPSTDQKRLYDFKTKVNAVLGQLDLSITLYAATEKDQFRKPRRGMWNEMKEDYDYDVDPMSTIDLKSSIFIGDAAGRQSGRDFASSDRDFATNLGIQFKTPEEFFLNEPPKEFARYFDPNQYLSETQSGTVAFSRLHPLEVIVFCGSPGAGKSTFYWKHLAELGYVRVNQDLLKSRDRCLKVAREQLQAQQSVVVDATNANPETREHWIRLGLEFHAPVRCVLFTADAKLCEHNDAVRAFNGELMNPEGRTILPRVALTSFASRYRAPTLAEGFEDIILVDFRFQGTLAQKSAWSQYWIS